MNMKMNWGKGVRDNAAEPFDGVLVKLYDDAGPGRYTMMEVWYGGAKRYHAVKCIDQFGVPLQQARKLARLWFEANLEKILKAQAEKAPEPMSGKEQFDLLNQKIKLQAELDQVLRDHDRAMTHYRIEYDRAARGERTKSVPTDQFKTFPVYGHRRVFNGGWFGEGEWDWESYQIDEERVRQYKQVPDYPTEPEYPNRVHQLKRLIEEIDHKLS